MGVIHTSSAAPTGLQYVNRDNDPGFGVLLCISTALGGLKDLNLGVLDMT
jgi:hypothetical protein